MSTSTTKRSPKGTAKTVWVKVSDIIPTKDNTRNFNDPARQESLKRLAANIKETGLLQPIVLRPHPNKPGKYDLRAGERRWHAHRLAGMVWIEARVKRMDDFEAEKTTFIENFHRESLTPMETALGIRKLVESKHQKKTSVREIAAHLGMPPSMVLRRARLTELTQDWQKSMTTNAFPSWGIGHFESIARFDAAVQKELFEEMNHFGHYEMMTLPALEKFLVSRTRFLKAAPWDVADETLVPEVGACTRCPFRSGCKPGLFDEMYEPEKAGKEDRCLNLSCWEKKAAAQHERKKADLQKKYPDLAIVSSHFNQRSEGLPGRESYDQAKEGERGSYRAFLDNGPERGKLFWAKPKKEARKKDIKALAGKEPGPTPLKERRAVYLKRRNVHVLNAMVQLMEKPGLKVPGLSQVLLCAVVFGTERNHSHADDSWKQFDKLESAAEGARVAQLWSQLVPVARQRLKSAAAQAEPNMEEAKRWALLLGLDLGKLHAAALQDIPDPKVWSTLNEDGTPKKSDVKTGLKKS